MASVLTWAKTSIGSAGALGQVHMASFVRREASFRIHAQSASATQSTLQT